MSKKIDNGGPAFARSSFASGMTWNPSQDGMTLRDYFAAKAMAALIAEPPWSEGSNSSVTVWTRDISDMAPVDLFATASYRMADAMLRAREVMP